MLQNTSLHSFLSKITPAFCGFILTSIFFFPPFSIKEGLPAIETVDFLLPVIGLIVLLRWHEIQFKKVAVFLLIFAAFIFLTIVVNDRLRYLSDHFEIYKLIKFGLLIFLFSFINPDTFYRFWIKPLFLALVFFNLLHYFDIFDINTFLEQVYFGNHNYTEFGLNSAGLPVSKRMMGFTANPNNNAVIFSIFAIIFIPKKDVTWKGFILFSIAVVMVFLCQSRTALFSFVLILLTYGALNFKAYKRLILLVVFSGASILLANVITLTTVGVGTPVNMEMVRKFEKRYPYLHWDEAQQLFINANIPGGIDNRDQYTYLESMAHGEFIEGSSMMGRYEIWAHLWQMIKKKPFFGHGPYKEYFYENVLYAENEFIFMTWRYGFIGLFIYLGLFAALTWLAFKHRKLDSGMNLLLVIILYSCTSLTNLPFAAITLNMLLGIMIGCFYADLKHHTKRDNLRS